jgi:hypothetical protein
MNASCERRAHYVEVPIVLRTIDNDVAALQKLRKVLGISYVRECGPGDAMAEFLRDIAGAAAIKISDDDAFHFARGAKVVNHRATHQACT